MSKPRSDSKLKLLSEERQEAIIEWCNEPKTEKCVGGYKHAREQLAADGIKASEGALSEFYSWWHLRRNFQRIDSRTSDFEEMLKRDFPSATADKIQEYGQKLFTLQAVAETDSKEFREMEYLRMHKETGATKARQKDAELKLAERRVQLLEDNQAKAKEKLQSVIAKSTNVISRETLETLEQAAKLL